MKQHLSRIFSGVARHGTSPAHSEALEPRTLLAAGTLSEQIIVDQFGYRPTARKIALFADPITGQNSVIAYTPGSTFQVRRASDDASVFSGSTMSWKSGATDTVSGDKVWSGEFTSLTTPGEYYIYDPTNNLRSYNFIINANLFNDILKTSIRMYYYQRSGIDITAACGGNWTHAASHVGPNQDTAARLYYSGAASGPVRDVSGGWYDAGDFNRYVSWTPGVIWDLLFAFESNPGAFADNTNIPESGNGVPDILDEVKYELDWLLKMQQSDGAVNNRVGGLSYNVGSGPAADTQPRYYTLATTWATSSFAAGLAYGARIFSQYDWQYPGYATTLRTAAEKAWNYLTATPAMTPSTGNDGAALAAGSDTCDASRDKRLRIWAAAELWKATGTAAYKTYFESNIKAADAVDSGQNPLLGGWPHFDPSLAMDLNRACVTYATTTGATSSLVSEIKTSIANMADGNIVSAYNNLDDPYRAFMWSGHYCWGSNQLKSNWANILLYAIKLNVNSANTAKYREIAEEYLHYFHGRNPLSQVYLSNMGTRGANLGGDKSVMQPYHGWFQDGSALYDGASSTYGPAPGYLAGGPNQYFSVSWIAPPYGEPAMKAFKDWNTAWNTSHQANENSWEITEPAIYYQAAYSLLLSTFATDTYAPTSQARLNLAASPTITLQFNENIGSTLAASDLSLANLTNPSSGAAVASVSYDSTTRRATVSLSPALLPNGNYRLILAAGSVADTAGNALSGNFTFDFFFLNGDANHDRAVDFSDLTAVAQHYNTASGATWDIGDFNSDGKVNFADLVTVAQNYNATLPLPAPLPGPATPLTASGIAVSTIPSAAPGSGASLASARNARRTGTTSSPAAGLEQTRPTIATRISSAHARSARTCMASCRKSTRAGSPRATAPAASAPGVQAPVIVFHPAPLLPPQAVASPFCDCRIRPRNALLIAGQSADGVWTGAV